MEPLRIANCSGFYGDRRAAPRELLEGGPIDVLTGDYLAELTMLILWRSRGRDPAKGYATSFLAQMEECLGLAVDKGVKVVANAGGLNPAGLAAELRALAGRLGLTVSVAHVEGDDLLGRLDELKAAGEPLAHLDTGRGLAEAGVTPVTANAYLGAWGIVAALEAGADVVVCGRVTDASLVVGPAAWHFGWAADDWDRLAGAVVAGHVLECGTQATGGNYAFLAGAARHPAARLPDRRGGRRRQRRRDQASRDRRAGLGGHGDRPAAVRDRQPGLRGPRRGRPLRHRPGHRASAPTGCACPAQGASRPPTG